MQRTRALRFAHLTDAHVQRARAAAEGFAACLEHAQSHPDKPQLIVLGGDNLMNVDGEGRDSANEQLSLFRSTLKNHCSTPIITCVGNHDIYKLDAVEGRKWAADAFGLASTFHTADHAGWRFITLDSTNPQGNSYKGKLDEPQMRWLERTLHDTPPTTHVCIVSHIPILAPCAYFDGLNEKTNDWVVPGAWMHIDARQLKDLFLKHPNVKLCISGHMHLIDTATYLGVTYACNGAVSGGWWKGNHHEFSPAYALIDLYTDGSADIQPVHYPWTPRD